MTQGWIILPLSLLLKEENLKSGRTRFSVLFYVCILRCLQVFYK